MKITYLAYTKQPDKSTRLSVVSYDEWKQVLAIPTDIFQRFTPEHFPEQAQMTRDDFMIICGDFGGCMGRRQKGCPQPRPAGKPAVYHIVCQREPRKLRPAQEIPHRGMERRKSPADSASCNPSDARAGL